MLLAQLKPKSLGRLFFQRRADSSMMRRRAITLAVTALLGSCHSTDPEWGDIGSLWGRVEGTVATSTGTRVPGAELAFRLLLDTSTPGDCDWEVPEGVTIEHADSAGSFSVLLQGLTVAPPECLELTATPPPLSGLTERIDTISVDFSDRTETAPTYSIHVVLDE